MIVQSGPGQFERLPQTVSSPKEPLMITSTPAGPLEQVSFPKRSEAPMISDVIKAPGSTSYLWSFVFDGRDVASEQPGAAGVLHSEPGTVAPMEAPGAAATPRSAKRRTIGSRTRRGTRGSVMTTPFDGPDESPRKTAQTVFPEDARACQEKSWAECDGPWSRGRRRDTARPFPAMSRERGRSGGRSRDGAPSALATRCTTRAVA